MDAGARHGRPGAAHSRLLVPAPRDGLCLDYANTRCWRGREPPDERLATLDDLLRWLGDAGVPGASIREAKRWAAAHDRPEDVLAEAIALREAIYRIFSALAQGTRIAPSEMRMLAAAVASAPPRDTIARAGRRFVWELKSQHGRGRYSIPVLLAPVLWSAADLLVGAAHRQVRQCANGECLWLFLDLSRGGSRRWCDMASCGNRAKARRHYLKRRPPRAPGATRVLAPGVSK